MVAAPTARCNRTSARLVAALVLAARAAFLLVSTTVRKQQLNGISVDGSVVPKKKNLPNNFTTASSNHPLVQRPPPPQQQDTPPIQKKLSNSTASNHNLIQRPPPPPPQQQHKLNNSPASSNHHIQHPPQQQHTPPIQKKPNNSAASNHNLIQHPPTQQQDTPPQLCSRDQVRDGSWHPVTLSAPAYIREHDVPTFQCYPENAAHFLQARLFRGGDAPPSWKSWEWRPNDPTCQWTTWSTEEFCRIAANQTILIVGDSLSFEHFVSLVFSTGGKVRDRVQHFSKRQHRNVVQTTCRGTVRIALRRSDDLSGLAAALNESRPDVLILNRGAHYKQDGALLRQMKNTINQVKQWLEEDCPQWNENSRCLAIWRTTVPGHIGCEQFKEPFNGTLAEMESRIQNRSLYSNHTWGFKWQDYQRQNLLVLDLWKQSQLLSSSSSSSKVQIMDAYEINVMRPDGHLAPTNDLDCLHSCYPGKMDVYNTLLLHHLKAYNSSNNRSNQSTINGAHEELADKGVDV